MALRLCASAQPLAPCGAPRQRHTLKQQQPSSGLASRRALQQPARPGQLLVARAEPTFNEGAAQVRRLVDRDRKELNLDELEAAFGAEPSPSAATPVNAAAADGAVSSGAAASAATRNLSQVNSSQADKTPVSPFGPPSSSAAASSPFGSGGAAVKRPFAEPAGLSPNMPTPKQDTAPWWTKITLTQVVIVLSFTTIIASMIGTFFFVLGTGAIHFNDN